MKVFSEETRRRMSESAKRRCTPEWRKWRSETLLTKLPLDRVKALYESGMSQVEIAAEFGVTQKVIWGFMRRHEIPRRPQVKRDQTGPNNSSWKGDGASYTALHARLYRAFGTPKRCEVCGTEDSGLTYDWANLTGHYEDINDYKRMCRSCHCKHDDKIRNISENRKEVQNAGE